MNNRDSNDGRDPSASRATKSMMQSGWMSLLAAMTWSAAAFHAAASASIVAASYFSAWISRMQHRLLIFFAKYGGAVIEEEHAPTQTEVEKDQAGTDTGGGWDAAPTPPSPTEQHDAPPNLFGGRPPKGQA